MPSSSSETNAAIVAPWGAILLTARNGELWEIGFKLEPPLPNERQAAEKGVFAPWVAAIDAALKKGHLLEETVLSNLLCGARGKTLSPFTLAVLRRAAKIERGTFLTYGALAADLGYPRAARAVGRALAGNPFPLLIPCHRVVARTMLTHLKASNPLALQGRAFGGRQNWTPIAAWLRANDIAPED